MIAEAHKEQGKRLKHLYTRTKEYFNFLKNIIYKIICQINSLFFKQKNYQDKKF